MVKERSKKSEAHRMGKMGWRRENEASANLQESHLKRSAQASVLH
jgi:hypothetical protein